VRSVTPAASRCQHTDVPSTNSDYDFKSVYASNLSLVGSGLWCSCELGSELSHAAPGTVPHVDPDACEQNVSAKGRGAGTEQTVTIAGSSAKGVGDGILGVSAKDRGAGKEHTIPIAGSSV